MLLQSLLLMVAAYLLGSIPTAHLATRWLRGADLRQYGSGTVSASMVWEHTARWASIAVGLFDIAKAAFPAWIGLELGLGTQVAVWQQGWLLSLVTTGRSFCASLADGG